jgi:hypothetical protein
MRAVTESPRARNTKEVRGFRGLTDYYHKFIRHYAHITLPGYRICKMSMKVKIGGRRGEPWLKDVGTVQFIWNGEAEEGFETLKDAICTAPVLPLREEGDEYISPMYLVTGSL